MHGFGFTSCSLRPAPGNEADSQRVIVLKPEAPQEQHYAYLEADDEHIDTSLFWLNYKNLMIMGCIMVAALIRPAGWGWVRCEA